MIFRSVRDDSGRVVDFAWEYANPAAERMSRRPAAELYGRRLLEVMPGIATASLFDRYLQVVETGEPRQTEVQYQDGEWDLWVRVTAARLGDGVAVSFADITPRKQAEEERERAIAVRNRFYAAMSHELRTPSNAIIGYTDLLLVGAYGELAAPQLQGINRAHRAAQHLLQLVDDVLDFSKLEAGKTEITVEPTVLPDLVEDLFTTVRPLAEDRGCELRLRNEGCDAPLLTDPRRVRQILMNLISSAIKFREGGPVEVHCRSGEHGDAVVEVVDHGAGTAEEELPRAFEEFVQLANATDRTGTGLGLPISRRLAERLGGRLEVHSVVGQGSTFRLVLPAVRAGSSLLSVPEA